MPVDGGRSSVDPQFGWHRRFAYGLTNGVRRIDPAIDDLLPVAIGIPTIDAAPCQVDDHITSFQFVGPMFFCVTAIPAPISNIIAICSRRSPIAAIIRCFYHLSAKDDDVVVSAPPLSQRLA